MSTHQFSKQFILLTSAAGGLFLIKYLLSKLQNLQKKKVCIVIQSVEEWKTHEAEILRIFEQACVVGIDCEWVTIGNKRSPISLLQLANKDGYCVLIRLCCFSAWTVPIGLSELLENRNILKVGVGVSEDANKLFSDYCLQLQGFLDLRYLAKDLSELHGKGLGLKSLAKQLLNHDMNKSKYLRCSDWDSNELTADQIHYAADDALVAAKLFYEIKKRKSYWFSFSSHFSETVELHMDVPFKQTFNNNNNDNSLIKSNIRATKKSLKTRYSKPRQRPMYDNCQLVAPDGELLCSCDRGKAEWYVLKNLGEVINEDPFTVRLNFEPSGRPKLDNIFYTMEKTNCCVVCGRTENYHRKLVVPSEYRRYFPDLMKKNLSHDVLLLCVDCHKKSNILDQNMRLKLADLCNAPLVNSKNAKYKFNPQMARVKSAATALIVSGHKIPLARKKELEKIITDYFNVQEITEEILKDACNVDTTFLNESFTPHGLKVYQYFCKNGGLIHFEKLWRQHFLDTMQPKFLPPMWSIEHNHKRLALQVINREREVNFDASILGLDEELLREIEEYQNQEI